MKILDLLQTANTNLLRSKLRTFLTALAITVGSFTLALTSGLGEGVKDFLNKQTASVSIKDMITVIPSAGTDMQMATGVTEYNPNKKKELTQSFITQRDVDKIKAIKGVKDVYMVEVTVPEYITTQGQKKYNLTSPNLFVESLELPLAAGSMPSGDDKDAILLANEYLKPLGFETAKDAIGKTVSIAFKSVSGEVKTFDFKIAGVQIKSLSGSSMRINVTKNQDIVKFQYGELNAGQAAIAILEKNTSSKKVETIKRELKNNGYMGITYEDQMKTINQFINIAQAVINGFAIIVIIAAAIGIINTLLMSVYERTREIGLMKALGMQKSEIFLIFAFEAGSIGFWGGLLGILLAFLASLIINPIASNTFLKGFEGFTLLYFPFWVTIPIVLGTIIVGFLAGTLPAIKASNLDPIEALRYE